VVRISMSACKNLMKRFWIYRKIPINGLLRLALRVSSPYICY